MDLKERIKKKEYLYISEGNEMKMGRQYNINTTEFLEFASYELFNMLFNQFIIKNKNHIKKYI